MLQLRPKCENCQCALPPDSTLAMICSYECTFCKDCVEHTLLNVCPNCGGGFTPRPIRPKSAWRTGVSLAANPASDKNVFKPVDKVEHLAFAQGISKLEPKER